MTNIKDVLEKEYNSSLNVLSIKIREHSRHAMLSFLKFPTSASLAHFGCMILHF